MDVANERIFNPFALAVSSAGRSRRQGLDVRTDWRARPWLSLAAGGTWNDARFLGTPPSDGTLAPPSPDFHDHLVPMRPGDPVPGVARWTGHAGADARVRGLDVSARWRFLGPFVPIGEPGVTTRAASVLDLGIVIPAGRVAFDVALQNALDLRYVENRASGFITPGLPRVLRLTIRTNGA
jgi:outer membrane receptor protein involved in Fe transport